jgi:hypothetical protein
MSDTLGRRKYEVRLFNERVRRNLDDGEENNTGWDDKWAEAHYETVLAQSAEQAKEMMYNRYPKIAGFKVTHVLEINDKE